MRAVVYCQACLWFDCCLPALFTLLTKNIPSIRDLKKLPRSFTRYQNPSRSKTPFHLSNQTLSYLRAPICFQLIPIDFLNPYATCRTSFTFSAKIPVRRWLGPCIWAEPRAAARHIFEASYNLPLLSTPQDVVITNDDEL